MWFSSTTAFQLIPNPNAIIDLPELALAGALRVVAGKASATCKELALRCIIVSTGDSVYPSWWGTNGTGHALPVPVLGRSHSDCRGAVANLKLLMLAA